MRKNLKIENEQLEPTVGAYNEAAEGNYRPLPLP